MADKELSFEVLEEVDNIKFPIFDVSLTIFTSLWFVRIEAQLIMKTYHTDFSQISLFVNAGRR